MPKASKEKQLPPEFYATLKTMLETKPKPHEPLKAVNSPKAKVVKRAVGNEPGDR